MLGLLAAQLKYKVESQQLTNGQATWVDVSLYQLMKLHERDTEQYIRLVGALGKC